MINIRCYKCGKLFNGYLSRIKVGRKNFCSRKCYTKEFRGPQVEYINLVCVVCGKQFSRPPSMVNGRKNISCSNECRYELRRNGKWIPYNKIDNETLINDLENLAYKLKRLPNTQDVNNEWSGRQILYGRRFGSLRNAIKLCDLDKVFPQSRISGITAVPFFYYTRRYDNKTIKLQGTYEIKFANILDGNSVKWLSHGEFDPLFYIDEFGKRRKYHPDFFIPSMNVYIETKGWFHDKAKIKMELCISQNRDKKIVILFKDDIDKIENDYSTIFQY